MKMETSERAKFQTKKKEKGRKKKKKGVAINHTNG